jgi:hypothetical protein
MRVGDSNRALRIWPRSMSSTRPRRVIGFLATSNSRRCVATRKMPPKIHVSCGRAIAIARISSPGFSSRASFAYSPVAIRPDTPSRSCASRMIS